MNNVQIIELNTVLLIEEGKLPKDAVLNTYKGWERLGFQVKKGEKHTAEFPIWMPSKKKVKVDEENDEEVKVVGNRRFYKKLSFFFTQRQVEPLQKGAQK